jgi:hypothetical protein
MANKEYMVHGTENDVSIDELISFLQEIRKEQGPVFVDMRDPELGDGNTIRAAIIVEEYGEKYLRLQ